MKFKLGGPSDAPVIGQAAIALERLIRQQFSHASREDLVSAITGVLARSLVQLDDAAGAANSIAGLFAGIAEKHSVPGVVVIVGPLDKVRA